MTMPFLLLSLSLAVVQAPQPQPETAPAAAVRRDIIELRGGEVLEGRITLERGNYVEIELAPGSTVGFRTTEVVAVRHGAGAPAQAEAVHALPPRDEWFTLHDAQGAAVGWLHGAVTATEDGGARLTEEWEFTDGKSHFQVTVLETVDRALRPLSSYFRERINEEVIGHVPGDPMSRTSRVRNERIVEAKVVGERLHVERLRVDGRTERDLPWPDGASFPLLARERCRGDAASTVTVFDPALEEIAARDFAADRRRTVAIDGKSVAVTERFEASSSGRNAIWLDASARVLRREIAGPSLVAVPSTADQAVAAVARGTAVAPAFAAEAGGHFGLWRPNPAWEVLPPADGVVALRCDLHDALISLSVLDHLDKGTALSAAADSVERWFHLLQPGQHVEGREWIKVRDRDAIRLTAKGRRGDRPEGALLVVVPWQDAFLVLRCSAPAAALEELQPDFAAVIAHLELDSKAVTALLPKNGKQLAAATVPHAGVALPPMPALPGAAASGTSSGAAPKVDRPHVRVPLSEQGK